MEIESYKLLVSACILFVSYIHPSCSLGLFKLIGCNESKQHVHTWDCVSLGEGKNGSVSRRVNFDWVMTLRHDFGNFRLSWNNGIWGGENSPRTRLQRPYLLVQHLNRQGIEWQDSYIMATNSFERLQVHTSPRCQD